MAYCAVMSDLDAHERYEYNEEMYLKIERDLMEEDLYERRNWVINKFYDNGMSLSVAKSAAKLWARALIENDTDDDACMIALRFDIDVIDAYAVVEDYKKFAKEYNELHKNDY